MRPDRIFYYVREVKHELTRLSTVDIDTRRLSGKDGRFKLTRSETEQLWKPLVNRTIEVCERAIHQASCQVNQIDHIILVGGSSQIPIVRTKSLVSSVSPHHRR